MMLQKDQEQLKLKIQIKNDADIVYVEAHTTADIIQQYKVERVKSCKGKSNCKDNVWTQPRVMTENEIEVVKKVLIDRVEEDLINREIGRAHV